MSQTTNFPKQFFDLIPDLASRLIGEPSIPWGGLNLNPGNAKVVAAGSTADDAAVINTPVSLVQADADTNGVRLHVNQGFGLIVNDGDSAFVVYPPTGHSIYDAGASVNLAEGDAILFARLFNIGGTPYYAFATLTLST